MPSLPRHPSPLSSRSWCIRTCATCWLARELLPKTRAASTSCHCPRRGKTWSTQRLSRPCPTCRRSLSWAASSGTARHCLSRSVAKLALSSFPGFSTHCWSLYTSQQYFVNNSLPPTPRFVFLFLGFLYSFSLTHHPFFSPFLSLI